MKIKPLFSILVIAALFSLPVRAQDFPDPMNPPRLVNDFTSFLGDNESRSLEQTLLEFNNRTSTQIYIVTVEDLMGYDPADYATRLAERWGIGQKGKDNGILILVKPKTAAMKGEVFITVGYGLEGVVPDAVANRIVDQEIIPRFREGDFNGGLTAAVQTLMSLTEGEFTAENYMQQSESVPGAAIGGGLVFFIIMIIAALAGRSRTGRHRSIGSDLPLWLLLGMMGSGRSRGMFGDFSSGKGGFGGFGGGGFGGFGGGGGGSFGGGGAGGSW